MSKAQGAVIGMDDKWQAEDDARTLVRAAEIKMDKPRFDRARKVLESMKQATIEASASTKTGGK